MKDTRQLERELTAVLHRHAEDAMKRTNTIVEHQKLQSAVTADQAPTDPRRRWVVGGVAAAAAAAVTVGIALSSPDTATDPSRPPIAQAPETATTDLDAAKGFAAAFADHDPTAAASHLAPGEEPWGGWRAGWRRDSAWGVEYLMEPCTRKYDMADSTVFDCPFAMHLLGSREVGEGPFRGNILHVTVADGQVTSADSTIPFDTNGVGQHLDSVHAWVAENHPKDDRFLSKAEEDLKAGEWPRWTRLWKQYIREYVAATNEAG